VEIAAAVTQRGKQRPPGPPDHFESGRCNCGDIRGETHRLNGLMVDKYFFPVELIATPVSKPGKICGTQRCREGGFINFSYFYQYEL